MKKRHANPTAIGLFVLGALTIGVLSIILFGSRSWFGGDRVSMVCFFEDAVDGLQIGSKVKLRGVPIGEVKRILIRFKPAASEDETVKALIPVIIELDLGRLSEDLGVNMDFRNEKLYQNHINEGLRASLGMGNLITGILQVNLDYHKDAEPATDLGPLTYRGDVYRRIPTRPSQLAAATNDLLGVVNNISKADFKGVVDGLNELLEKLSGKLDQFEVKGINEAIDAITERMQSPKFDEALTAFSKAADSVGGATDAVKDVAADLGDQLDDEQLADALTSANETFQSLTAATEQLQTLLENSQNMPPELERSVKELGEAAAEIKEFVRYLRERPNALIFGKKDNDEPSERSESKRKPWRGGPRSR